MAAIGCRWTHGVPHGIQLALHDLVERLEEPVLERELAAVYLATLADLLQASVHHLHHRLLDHPAHPAAGHEQYTSKQCTVSFGTNINTKAQLSSPLACGIDPTATTIPTAHSNTHLPLPTNK